MTGMEFKVKFSHIMEKAGPRQVYGVNDTKHMQTIPDSQWFYVRLFYFMLLQK